MNVRSVLGKGFAPAFLVAAMAAGFACGPKEPPKQAGDNGPPDPLTESSSSTSSGFQPGKSSSGGGTDTMAPPSGPPVKSRAGEAPQVPTLATFQEGVQWGLTHAELQKQFTQTGGVIWKDYDEKLAKARVGPEQTALEAERESMKGAFGRSYIEFGATPTGYDSTGISKEFTYRNKESLMWIERKGKKRYFFFINDKLWKMYDEIPFQSGLMGASYQEAVAKINATLNATGRTLPVAPDKGVDKPTTDWKDTRSHLRAIDRSNEGIVGVAIEDLAILSNLAALRPNKPSDPNELDPSIVAVTRGRPDPNAAPSASASGKKPAPPPKKK